MSVAFQHGIDDIVQQLIINKGWGSLPPYVSTPWPVFAGGEPPEPDELITVYETTPVSFGKVQIDGEQLQHYGFTIRIRGQTKAAARNKGETIRKGMNESVYRDTVTLDGISYVVLCVSKCSLVPFGTEASESKRWLVNLNCVGCILPQPIST